MGVVDELSSQMRATLMENAKAAQAEQTQLAKELTKKYTELAIKELNDICKNAVERFYSSYGPATYHRSGALQDVYKISGNASTGELIIDFTNSLPGHQSGEYIFYIVFELGYHGGSTGTDKSGASRSVPSYRSPIPDFTHWSKAATKGVSPYKEIYLKANACFKRLNDQYFAEIAERGDQIAAKYGFKRR